MTVLVHSVRNDLHADAVIWGLERIGASCQFWPAGEFPADQHLSAYLSPEEQRYRIDYSGVSLDLDTVSVVWNRRSAAPRLSLALDVRDREYAQQQSRQHVDAFMSVACSNALWVNKPEVAKAELNKLCQLNIARRVGLCIPPTLCSNSPALIREFYYRQIGEVIFKSYKLGGWTEGTGDRGSIFVGYTTNIAESDLDNDNVLSFSPGIFQRRIPRHFEVRTTIMGATAMSASIRTLTQGVDDVDWRFQPRHELLVESFQLPLKIEEKLHRFMKLAGMVFCSFDLIVNSDGRFFFLEANQMGQFLWKEEQDPNLNMLDVMCRFLASADPQYKWRRVDETVHYQDYLASDRYNRLQHLDSQSSNR